VIDAWQGGVVTRRIFLSLNGAGLRIGAPSEALEVLFWHVLAIFSVALSQKLSQQWLAGQFFFDFLEASTAIDFLFAWAAARIGDFFTRLGIHTPAVASRSVTLFSAVIAIFSATRSVETRGTSTATLFHDLSEAWAFFFQRFVHVESDQACFAIAVDHTLGTWSSTRAFNFFTCVFVHTPALTN